MELLKNAAERLTRDPADVPGIGVLGTALRMQNPAAAQVEAATSALRGVTSFLRPAFSPMSMEADKALKRTVAPTIGMRG